jgi:hypothetical protein
MAKNERQPVVIALAAYRPNLTYFREQLASIAAQTSREWICVIGIDGDAEALMARPELAEHVADPRFVWRGNPERLGHRRNFERVIAAAAQMGAEYIACADQDDVWHPEKIERLLGRARSLAPLAVVHSDMQLMRDGHIEHESGWRASRQGVEYDHLWQVLVANIVTGCTMLFDAELARRYPTIPESFSFHDHWFAALAAAHGGIHRIDTPLVRYRQHADNVVGTSEFDWGVQVPGPGSWRHEIDACAERWHRVRERASDLSSVGIGLDWSSRIALVSRIDLGLLAMLRGILLMWRAPKLARYLMRLGIGKLASTLGLARVI